MLDLGERLASYEPLWENWYKDCYIGGGTFGKVYRLKQDFFGETRYSAVKIIPIVLESELSSVTEDKDGFLKKKKASMVQEIKNMYQLKGHKNLVQVIAHSIKDIFDDNGEVIGFDVLIQMEYYMALPAYMRENGLLTEPQVERLAKDIATGLKAMHDINMTHRDIKIGNIFVDKDGNLALGDFGISKQDVRSSYSTMAGTHSFIAPEVWKIRDTNKRYNKTADIYSYGIVLYCLFNDNLLPLVNEGSSTNEVGDAIDARLAGQSFPPPKNGSERMKSIVMKCCAYRSEDRFQNMDEVLAALDDPGYTAPVSASEAVDASFDDATVFANENDGQQDDIAVDMNSGSYNAAPYSYQTHEQGSAPSLHPVQVIQPAGDIQPVHNAADVQSFQSLKNVQFEPAEQPAKKRASGKKILISLASVLIVAAVAVGTAFGLSKNNSKSSSGSDERLSPLDEKGVHEFEGHYYKTYDVTDEESMNDCEDKCVSMGGHLVSIGGRNEQKFVISMMGDKRNYWLGLVRDGDSWKWLDGSRYIYDNWNDGQPDDHGGREDAVRIAAEYKSYDDWEVHKGCWLDIEATGDYTAPMSSFGYICEWSEEPDLSVVE